jgi:hypothetical protein
MNSWFQNMSFGMTVNLVLSEIGLKLKRPIICQIGLKNRGPGVDGNVHFPVPSMNRLNQTKPATFSILLCWTFFRDSVFLYFINMLHIHFGTKLTMSSHLVSQTVSGR